MYQLKRKIRRFASVDIPPAQQSVNQPPHYGCDCLSGRWQSLSQNLPRKMSAAGSLRPPGWLLG
jgi:hypothetical protein